VSYDFEVYEIASPEPCVCGRPRRRANLDFGDPTYNISEIFSRAAGGALRDLVDHKPIPEVLAVFERMQAAFALADTDPIELAEYKKLEPKNGWGSFNGARRKVREVISGLRMIVESGGLEVEEFSRLHEDYPGDDGSPGTTRFVPTEKLRWSI